MEGSSKLSIQERYRLAIESLISFDFQRRETDLKWMLAESKKPYMGLSWLKEKYYELLRKCEEHPVPFQLVYDLEVIAARIFPRAARKFTFVRDPINEYFRTRLKYYDPEIKRLISAETFHIKDLLPILGTMGERDGRSMVEMFLAQLSRGKVYKPLAGRAAPDLVSKLVLALEGIPQTADADDLGVLLEHAIESESSPDVVPVLNGHSVETELNGNGFTGSDASAFPDTIIGPDTESSFMNDLSEDIPLSNQETPTLVGNDEPLPLYESNEQSELRDESASHESVDSMEEHDADANSESIAPDELNESHAMDMSTDFDLPQSALDDDTENLSLTGNDLLSSETESLTPDANIESYPNDFLDTDGTSPDQTLGDQQGPSGDQHSRDLRSDAAYKEFLLEQSELVVARKDRILEDSGLASRIDRAEQKEEESVQLLAELHPLAFLSQQERLLRGLDPIESPLGKIMAHLSQMYRKLNIPDMRAYVDYYTSQLDEAGLFDTFPTIRERLLNYRKSLIDPPPELLKQVHMGLQKIEDDLKSDHRKCVESQVNFLHDCLENQVFERVWPTIAVILENLIKAELESLGERIRVSPIDSAAWRGRLSAEERTQPRTIQTILADVEPASSEGIADILNYSRKRVDLQRSEGTNRPNFLAMRSDDPEQDAKRMQESLKDFFSEDFQGAMQLSQEILNGPEYSLVERETTLRVLHGQDQVSAAELFHLDRLVASAGGTSEQLECAESLRTGVTSRLIDQRISGINLKRAQNESMQRFSGFLASKDPAIKSRAFQEIQKNPHIPEGMKTLFRKSADVNEFGNYLESIITSSLSSADKLKLLRVLKQVAAHRKWLTPVSETRIDNKIKFYERILAADRTREEIVANRHTIYRTHRAEVTQALIEGKAKSIDSLLKRDPSEHVSATHAGLKTIAQDHEESVVEESHHHGFSDEFLEDLIQNRMRAARWYTRLPEDSREILHKQAELPGNAQILVHQIEKDNAFKKALRHLKKPVNQAMLEELSAKYPEEEYQSKLKEFRIPIRASSSSASDAARPSSPNVSEKVQAQSAIQLNDSLDRMLDAAAHSAPTFDPLPPVSMDDDESTGWVTNVNTRPHADAGQKKSREGSHPPAEKLHSHSSNDSQAGSPHASVSSTPHNKPGDHHESRDRAVHHEDHGAGSSAVEGLASSLARGFSSLFSKPKQTSRSNDDKHPARASTAAAGKSREKNSGAKKAQKAAAELMKGISAYSKGEVYLSEKDLKALEKDMEKHPDSRRLMEDHSYLFKVDHPDPAQFQPPIFVIIPEMKSLNHDQSRKKAAMTKLEQAISAAPAKKKAHLQALLTFMERYKTK